VSTFDAMHLTEEQLDDYADGVISDASRALADVHLAACDQCRHALGDTREIIALAQREQVAVSAPAELWPMVASSTIHFAAMRRRVLASMRGALIVGALAIAAASAVVTWKVARWTMTPRVVVQPARVGRPGPGQHAGHPTRTAPTAPPAPEAPRAPEP